MIFNQFICSAKTNQIVLFVDVIYVDTVRVTETYIHNVYPKYRVFKSTGRRVVKSRRMRWAGHVARMGEDRGVHRVLVGKPEGKSHWGDQDVDGRIILRWIFRKFEGVVGTGWSCLRIGIGGGHLWVQ